MFSTSKVPPVRLARAVERVRHHLYRFHQRLVPAPVAMMEFITGAGVLQAIAVAADLGVADVLAKGPLPIDDLATEVGADPDALRRLMRALISRGVFRQRRDGRYDLTPLADTLRCDAPASMSSAVLMWGSPQHREHWSLLVDSVRTGRESVSVLRGKPAFEYLASEPEVGAKFNQAMTSVSELVVAPVVAAYDFSGYRTIVDLGGGHGRLLAAILEATPAATGVLYDLPQVVAGAPPLLRELRVAHRVRIEEGSFFDSVPGEADAYLLKNVIHDWDDDKAVEILRNVRAAAHSDSNVLIVELVIPEHNREFVGKWADMEMLLCTEGRERTADEYRELLERAGFRMTRLVQTASPFSIVEGAVV